MTVCALTDLIQDNTATSRTVNLDIKKRILRVEYT